MFRCRQRASNAVEWASRTAGTLRSFVAARDAGVQRAGFEQIERCCGLSARFPGDRGEPDSASPVFTGETGYRGSVRHLSESLLGGLFGLAVTLALDPEKARGLMRLAGAVFQWLWGGVQEYLE